MIFPIDKDSKIKAIPFITSPGMGKFMESKPLTMHDRRPLD